MRLLNTQTGRLEQFIDENQAMYAILSHTWEGKEPTYQDFLANPGPILQSAKVKGLMKQVREGHLHYVWIDTICIDKTSSAELQEAINSMYKWYKGAGVCYAYLSDVDSAAGDITHQDSAFRKSRWFTRGWTLQELLAPRQVIFFDKTWCEICRKFSLDPSLLSLYTSLLSSITGIPHRILAWDDDVLNVCIAQKMSWAEKRETTREEDQAYSLLGLLGVNMPMLYGEGSRAFTRLRHEIMKQSTDHSLLAYNYHPQPQLTWGEPQPSHYSGCTNVERMAASTKAKLREASLAQANNNNDMSHDYGFEHYEMTNMGLHIWLDVIEVPGVQGMMVARLDCVVAKKDRAASDEAVRVVAIPLYQAHDDDSVVRPNQQMLRDHKTCLVDLPLGLFCDRRRTTTRRLYVIDHHIPVMPTPLFEFQVQMSISSKSLGFTMTEMYPFSDLYLHHIRPYENNEFRAGVDIKFVARIPAAYVRLQVDDQDFDIMMRVDVTYGRRPLDNIRKVKLSMMYTPRAYASSLLEMILMGNTETEVVGGEWATMSFKSSVDVKRTLNKVEISAHAYGKSMQNYIRHIIDIELERPGELAD